MAGKVKTWVWVVVGIVVVSCLRSSPWPAARFYFLSRHIDTKVGDTRRRRREFEAVRARFCGQKPLIELDERGGFVRANPDRPRPADAACLISSDVLAFDPDEAG